MTFESPQSITIESQEKPKKVLIIDDYHDLITAFEALFSDNEAVSVVECHSLEDARSAILSVTPDVLLLDHNFGPAGGEGLIIANEVRKDHPDIKIYSTTTDLEMIPEYAKLGIAHVNKKILTEMMAVVDEATNPRENS